MKQGPELAPFLIRLELFNLKPITYNGFFLSALIRVHQRLLCSWRLEELDLIAFGIHDPGEASILLILAAQDLDPFRL
jgi:hypothetical protein